VKFGFDNQGAMRSAWFLLAANLNEWRLKRQKFFFVTFFFGRLVRGDEGL
jgi:hypothetical protein